VRKIVQIAFEPEKGGSTYVLCDDGSVWLLCYRQERISESHTDWIPEWRRAAWPDIPQDEPTK
jgi:hypothetical protein